LSRYADVLHVLSAWGGRELSSGGVGHGDDEVQAESDHPRDAYP
jgi:hypothetical protein